MTAPWSSTVMKDLWISVATHGTAGGLEDGHRRVGQSSEVVERMEAMNDDQAELEEFGKRWAGSRTGPRPHPPGCRSRCGGS
jgi:hypothetical protein